MIFLIRRLAGSWRSTTQGRLLYIVIASAFCGLAVVAAVGGSAGVALVAAVVAIVTLGLAVIAPRLSAAQRRLRE
ncbi:MAG: hypothetical protein IIB22_12030 [Chloroflexi bacterium]|nr:hypothetical protein [Chloroflexota bacterium]